MSIEIKLTCPGNKQLQRVAGCVSWSPFDPKQTETVFFLLGFFSFSKIKSIYETLWLRMIESSLLFANITNLESRE